MSEQQTVQPEANGKEAVTGTEQRPSLRSGYARLKSRHRRLIAEHEAVKAECFQWKQMYLEMKDVLSPLIDAEAERLGASHHE